VRVGYRGDRIQEQPHPRLYAKRVRSAKVIDPLAVDIFDHQELVTVDRAGIEQARDVRMAEAREQPALVAEAVCELRLGKEAVEELDGAAAFEAAVAARGEPDLAHAAAADEPIERVRTDLLAGEGGAVAFGQVGDGARRILQEAARIQRFALGQEIAQRRRDERLRRGQLLQPALEIVRFQVERPIQVSAELAPQRWIERSQTHAVDCRRIAMLCDEREFKRTRAARAELYSQPCVSGIARKLR
jgi:hypothetical protein